MADDLRIVLYATINKTKSIAQLKDDLQKIKEQLEKSNAAKIQLKLALAQGEIKKIQDQLRKISPQKVVIGKVDDRQIDKLFQKIEKIKKDLNALNEQKISFGRIDMRQWDQAQKAAEKIRKEMENFRNVGVAKNLDNINSVRQQLQELYSGMFKNVEIVDFRQVTDKAGQAVYKYTAQVKEGSGVIRNFKGEIDKSTGAIREQIIQVKKHDSELDMLSNRFKTAIMSVPVWMGAMTAIYGPIQALKELMSVAIEVDKQMTEMKRVMDQDTNFNQVLQGNIAMAKELSRSLTDVNQAYIEFVKQGLGEKDAREMARAALLAQNVSDLSSDEAIQSLTAAVTQFKLKASDAMKVVDAWNQVDNQFATTTRDLATAMAKSGAVAQTFGVSMNQMIGHITAIQTATKESGEVVGNALKAIYQNIVGKPEAIKALEQVGIKVKEQNGQIRRAGEVLDELAKHWNDLTDAERQNVAMKVAGTYQLARFTALMNNYNIALQAAQVAENSAGSAMRENMRYQQSFAAQIERLNVAWEELAVAVGNSGFGDSVQVAISALTGFLEVLSKLISTFGFFPTVLIPTSTAVLAFSQNIRTMVAELIFGKEALDALTESARATKVALASIGVGVVITALSFVLEYLMGKWNEYRKVQEQAEQTVEQTYDVMINHGAEVKNLADQYDKLSKKTSKSQEDIAKLNDVQNKLGQLMPSVVEKIDANGQAHLMSAEAIKQHIAQAEKLAQLYNQMNIDQFSSKFEEAFSKLQDANNNISDLQNELKQPLVRPVVIPSGMIVDSEQDQMKKRIEDETQLQLALVDRMQAEMQAVNLTKQYFEAQLYLSGSLEKLSDADKAYYETLIQNNMAYILSIKDSNKAQAEAAKMAQRYAEEAQKVVQKRAALGDVDLPTERVRQLSLANAQAIGQATKAFENGQMSLKEFHDSIIQAGLSEEEFEQIVEQVNNKLDAQSKKVINLATAQEKLKAVVDDFFKSTQVLTDAQNTLNQGQELSLKQIFDLIVAYPKLGKSLKVQNGYLTIQGEAIQNLIDLQKEKLKADILMTKTEIEHTQATLKANIEKVKTELQLYDLLSRARKDNINQILAEAKAQIYAQEMMKIQFTGNPFQDAMAVTWASYYASRRYQMAEQQIKQVADWNDQISNLDDLSKGLDTLAKNIDKVSNSLTGSDGLADSVKQTVYIVDKFANAMGDLANRIKEVESLQKRYPKFSESYRKAIQQEIDLLKQKINLLNNERNSLSQQIATGNIQPTGMVTISGNNPYYSSSSSVASYYLSSPFRLTSRFGEWRGDHYHGGIDLAAPTGTPIRSLIDGYVARKGYQAGGAGYYIVIADGHGRETKYFHMIAPSPLSVGQRVAAGTIIGSVGSTGHSSGPHLHLEVLINGKRIDPLKYLNELRGTVTNSISVATKAYTGKYASYINEAARRYGVDPWLIASVIKWESDFNPYARSSVGARGLMQLMPGTARSLGVTNPYDPYQNIMAGTKYLAQLLRMFSGDVQKALAAYNWGPGNVKRHPYDYPSVTDKYIANILSTYQKWTGHSYGSGSSMGGYYDSYAEWQQAIDEAKQKQRQLNDEYVDAVDQLMQLYQELVESQIEWYKHKQDELDNHLKLIEVNEQMYDNQDLRKYQYYLGQSTLIYKQKKEFYEQEAKYIEDQLKTNKNLTEAYRAELQMMQREAVANALEMQQNIFEANKKLADSILGGTVDQFAKQYDELSGKMDNIDKNLHMVDENDQATTLKLLKDKLRVYLEQRDAIKGQIEKLNQLKEQFKDYQEIVNRINDELKNWNNTLNNIETGMYDTQKQMKDVAQKVADNVIEVYKQMYEKQRDLELKSLDDRTKAAQEAHDKKMKMLDEEMKKFEDVINKQMKLLDDQENKYQFEHELSKRNEEIRKLQQDIERYSLDTSLEGRAKVKDLQDQLQKLLEDRDQFIHQHEVEERRKSLQEMLDDKRNQIDQERQLESDAYDQQTKEFEKMRDEINKKWENMLEDQRKFEEMRKQIIAGNINAIKNELSQFIDYIGKNTDEIGQSISNNLIDTINKALDSLKALYNFVHNPEPAQLPPSLQRPEGMPSNYEQIYKIRHSKFQTLQLGSEGEMVKKLQAVLGIPQTGKYDEATRQAVYNWQKAHGIYATGIADDNTIRALGFYDGRAPVIVPYFVPKDPDAKKIYQEWMKKLQHRLGLPETGVYDNKTFKALINFERSVGINPDGVLDDWTWEVLGIRTGLHYLPVIGKGLINNPEWVKKAQIALGLKPTGVYDEALKQAVIKFQKAHNIPPFGIIGLNTWKALGFKEPYDEYDQWWEENLANEQLRSDMARREDELWNIIANELGFNFDEQTTSIKNILNNKSSIWDKIQQMIDKKLNKTEQTTTPENVNNLWQRIYQRIIARQGIIPSILYDILAKQGNINIEITDKNAKPYVLQLIMNIDKLTGDKAGAEKLYKELIDKLKAEGIVL